MQEYQLGEVILEREFETHDSDGNVKVVKLLIGKPQPHMQQKRAWYCPLYITGIGDERVRGILGIDSLQALLLSLPIADALLLAFAKSEQKTIT